MADEEEPPAYHPGAGFEHDSREPLLDLTSELSGSEELWLIQWPHHDLPDIDGKEICISLDSNGCSGSFEDLSGKTYDIVSTVEDQGPSVFVSSVSETDIVGSISRRVSLVHYPDPKELEQRDAAKKSKRLHTPSGSSMKSLSHRSSDVTDISKLRKMHSSRSPGASAYSGPSYSKGNQTPRSSSSKGGGGSSRDSKRRHINSTTTTGPSQR
ncbi:Mediator-associated protein 2 [Linum perenne]